MLMMSCNSYRERLFRWLEFVCFKVVVIFISEINDRKLQQSAARGRTCSMIHDTAIKPIFFFSSTTIVLLCSDAVMETGDTDTTSKALHIYMHIIMRRQIHTSDLFV